jgi:hypothetical protein
MSYCIRCGDEITSDKNKALILISHGCVHVLRGEGLNLHVLCAKGRVESNRVGNLKPFVGQHLKYSASFIS